MEQDWKIDGMVLVQVYTIDLYMDNESWELEDQMLYGCSSIPEQVWIDSKSIAQSLPIEQKGGLTMGRV